MKKLVLSLLAVGFVSATAVGATLVAQVEESISPKAPAATSWSHQDVNCHDGSGRKLCNLIRRFRNLLVNCQGNACYSLWNRQIRTSKRVTRYYYDEIDYVADVSERLGDLAAHTARKLCRVKFTGDPSFVRRLAMEFNQLLNVFGELQQSAGTDHPYTCKFVVK